MKEHFQEYNDTLDRIKIVIAKIAAVKDDMYNLSGIKYGDMPKGSNKGADATFYLIEIEELEEELKALYERKKTLKNKHLKEIAKLSNSVHRAILEMYYIDKMPLWRIAKAIDKSESYIWNLKAKAVDAFIELNNSK